MPSARYDFATPVFGLISDRRAHTSRSPELFNRVMARVGLRGAYVPFEVAPENLGAAVASLRILNLAGGNVTVPYKEKVVPHLDVLSEGAQIIGAVNTIVHRNGVLKGYNTNAIGIMEAFNARGVPVGGARAVVFGTGGVARAATFILVWLQAAEVLVVGRDPDAAARLTAAIGGTAVSLERVADDPRTADIVVNATSVSGADEAPELAARVAAMPLDNCRLVCDLNYGRKDNFWQAAAAAGGAPFADGLDTLAFQARRSFFLWTGIEVPAAEFRRALEE